ncbi:MAG: hypothetical protein Q7J54_07170 [Candidatus Woesearchaeota archaeon]|nr:hypothetical protein [Candidatus Woesearchaeota archaeon]
MAHKSPICFYISVFFKVVTISGVGFMTTDEFKLSEIGAALVELIWLEGLEKISYSAPVKSFKETLPPNLPSNYIADGLLELRKADFLLFVPRQGLFKDNSYYEVNQNKINDYLFKPQEQKNSKP